MSSIQQLYSLFRSGATICTDTRKISPGCIFFALKGENFNGNHFAQQALQNGAAAVVVDEPIELQNDNILITDNVLTTLQQLANYHRRQLTIPFIGVTGSNGKTTTKELLQRVLSRKYKTLATTGNLNNHIGVPLTILSVNALHEAAIIEMGANHKGEIALLCSIAEPTHVLITNVGKAHLEGFGGFEGVKAGKGEMYEFAKKNNSVVFINQDNENLKDMLGDYSRSITYGSDERSDISGKIEIKNIYVSLRWKEKEKSHWNFIESKITGAYNFENILSAIAAGVHYNIPEDQIRIAIESYIPDNQRSQEILLDGNRIILDAYNANPSSMTAALQNFSNSFTGKKAVFLGDMFELGAASADEHNAIARLVENFRYDLVLMVGPEFKKSTAVTNAFYFDNSSSAVDWLKKNKPNNYSILIKGSRGSKMELLLEGLK
jgi:UDP-N-acetylmuramoyl-tripeptide--D-alanyl-D-alanine ligase